MLNCDDGDACTLDQCEAGTTCYYEPVQCDDGNPCTDDTCSPAAGCVETPIPGAACSDGSACTTSDACDGAGRCVGSTPLDCDDGRACTTDSCNPSSGCVHVSNDLDGDEVCGDVDLCPASVLGGTVVVEGCDSGVPNVLLASGCSITDRIAQCAAGAQNRGQFVMCVSSLTEDLRTAQVITGKEKSRIQKCAARVSPHPARHLRLRAREGP